MSIRGLFLTVSLAAALALAAPTGPVLAVEGYECEDVANAVDVLDDIDVELFFVDEVDEDTDEFLRWLTIELLESAEVEGDNKLIKYTESLRVAYNGKDLGGFEKYIGKIADRLDDIYDRDC